MNPANRRIVGSLLVIVAAGFAAGAWIVRGIGPMAFADGPKVALADYKAADPTGVPASLAQASLIEHGAYLARAADCMVCHTTQGGKEYAGGLGFKLPFGTLYSTNITPDKETGIGNYSDQDFLNAVHRGIRRDGARLYPAMPFASYTYMTEADALAIKAYLFSLPPVHAAAPENTLTFPFNQRWAMSFWSAVFNPDTRFQPDSSKSPEWNRGAYLAEAMAHCGECHTPRNLAFALDNRRKYAGAVTAGWRAFNISSDKATGIGGWRDDDSARHCSMAHQSVGGCHDKAHARRIHIRAHAGAQSGPRSPRAGHPRHVEGHLRPVHRLQDHQSPEHRDLAQRLSQRDAGKYDHRHPGPAREGQGVAGLLPAESANSGHAGGRDTPRRAQIAGDAQPWSMQRRIRRSSRYAMDSASKSARSSPMIGIPSSPRSVMRVPKRSTVVSTVRSVSCRSVRSLFS